MFSYAVVYSITFPANTGEEISEIERILDVVESVGVYVCPQSSLEEAEDAGFEGSYLTDLNIYGVQAEFMKSGV